MSAPRDAYWRAFAVTTLLLAPLVFWAVHADGAPAKTAPCHLEVLPVQRGGGRITYMGGAYCPGANVVYWQMTINRGGVPWAASSGVIIRTPLVSRRCDGRGPVTSFRAVLRVRAWYAAGAVERQTLRGTVTTGRCR